MFTKNYKCHGSLTMRLILMIGFLLSQSCWAQGLEKIKLAYASVAPGSDSTFLFAGQQLGFFKEHGIDLEIQIAGGAVAAASFVAAGTSDLALGTMEAVPSLVLKGAPIKAIYQFSHRPIFRLAFIKGSKIQSLKDMKGAKVGLLSVGSASSYVLQFLLNEAGLTVKDVQLVPLGVGASTIAAVKSGEVDTLIYHDTYYAILEANGIQMTYHSSPQLDKGFVGQAIFALDKTITTRKPAIEAFLRGLTKSLAYSTKDPAGATKAFAAAYPVIAKNINIEEQAWRERAKITYPVGGQWGYMEDLPFKNMLDVLYIGGLIKERPSLDKLYTNEFIKSANSLNGN